ncbi:MAG TPA: hypothetical protein VFA41_21855 [Ktedonobacteraceae bacterium]|jgi:hypothetical protein|nr:hypothetical protein [Ktedonobacteraceae bacterium]
MNPYEALHALFLGDLQELQKLQKKAWRVLPMTRTVKEEHLGRCCYLAEEFLSPAELRQLKQAVGLNEQQWHAYKAKISGQ